ncbi:1-acyl-sn-glycerol-3-phosphate acyltransferase [Aliifodinibius sp. S!AR15-10]|uniref:lysophospholipid acyltransferase family protein n=1 Tax=Aliifodinibius sp. S!AR15-10 TaxID=2950437 RepID=UPI002859F2E9|nr:lysophospholipid acyltransferase family protein [Aliifodinibius sp. S!AR15-10]MDR8392803.1 1-acyl-sn-glycerol-3-phosphate acyltransferase [Aliifodinibius sp. S!AR15-10]
MKSAIKSVFIWSAVLGLIAIWVPVLGVVRLFDRDPAHYRTGRLFRKLGKWITKVNPEWSIHISGNTEVDDRKPFIVVSNHLSNADIPLISNLPWEMKWIAKKELFEVPLSGWMMKMAGDIPVNRRDPRSQISTLKNAVHYLRNNCSVMFFPEGTRSRSGKLGRFTNGAFHLAIREQVPVLPLVIDGTQDCLPKNSWKFGRAPEIRLKVLDPILVEGLGSDDVDELMKKTRAAILDQLSEWRQQPTAEIDATTK